MNSMQSRLEENKKILIKKQSIYLECDFLFMSVCLSVCLRCVVGRGKERPLLLEREPETKRL